MPFCIKVFNSKKHFFNKRVTVVGPADSAFKIELGDFIDSFDYVIRFNKALFTWSQENEKYLGKKTDILVHNFYENIDKGGGGPLDIELFDQMGVKYLLNPKYNKEGWRMMFNFFFKHLKPYVIFVLGPKTSNNCLSYFTYPVRPTMGFFSLFMVLQSNCREIFITGFTFFKTPYAKGYRDNLLDLKENEKHIRDQGQHLPQLEFELFCSLLQTCVCKNIYVDEVLYSILIEEAPEIVSKVKVYNEN